MYSHDKPGNFPMTKTLKRFHPPVVSSIALNEGKGSPRHGTEITWFRGSLDTW